MVKNPRGGGGSKGRILQFRKGDPTKQAVINYG